MRAFGGGDTRHTAGKLRFATRGFFVRLRYMLAPWHFGVAAGRPRLAHSIPTAAFTLILCRHFKGRGGLAKCPKSEEFLFIFIHIRVTCCERFFDTKSVSAMLPGAAQDASRGALGGGSR